jgi:PilZ domain
MKSDALNEPEIIGIIERDVPTRLLDISRGGCLLESRQRIEDGTVAELRLQIEQDVFVDDVRITRCVLVKGSGSVYLIGAEFLQIHRPGERSIRRAINTILRGFFGQNARQAASRAVSGQNGDGNSAASPHTNSVFSAGEKAS